jgi:hypothetical protein
MAPGVREKSGVWYRLNRWREEQTTSGKHPTYGDLVRQYIALNKMKRFEKIPHGRASEAQGTAMTRIKSRYLVWVAAALLLTQGMKPYPPPTNLRIPPESTRTP